MNNLKTRKMCQISYYDQYGMNKTHHNVIECKDMSISGIIGDFVSKGYPIPASFKVTEYDEVTVVEQKKEKKFYCNYKKPDDTDWVTLTFFNDLKSCNSCNFYSVSDILCSMQNLPNGTEFEVYSIENGITSLVQSGTVSTPQVLKKKFEIYIRGVHHCSWELLTSFVDDENVDTSKLLERVLRYIKDVPKDTQYKVLDFKGGMVLSGSN